MAIYFGDARGQGSPRRHPTLLGRGAAFLADEGRGSDQPESMPVSTDEGQPSGPPADPFADYYRQEADPADPCVD